MDRAEATGFGIAAAGHLLLVGLLMASIDWCRTLSVLTFGSVVCELPASPPAMEVSFVEDAAAFASAPASVEQPAPAVGEELGPVEEAAEAPAAEPEPTPVPEPAPTAAPVPPRAAARPPEPVRPPVQRPVQSAEARPRPQPPRPTAQPQRQQQEQLRRQQLAARQQAAEQRAAQQRAAAARGQGQAQRSSGSVLDRLNREFGRGPAQARGSAPEPAAALSGPQRQALARNISGLIQPCAARATPPNGLARTISVDLRVTVGPNGSPSSHQLVGSSGTNDSNESYVGAVVDVAMRAVRACSSRIATLPDDHYGVPGGWRTFRYRFRFP